MAVSVLELYGLSEVSIDGWLLPGRSETSVEVSRQPCDWDIPELLCVDTDVKHGPLY